MKKKCIWLEGMKPGWYYPICKKGTSDSAPSRVPKDNKCKYCGKDIDIL